MKLYDYAASCNCYKARLLLAQLELPYERVPIDIFDGQTLTDEFARINPARTTPVLETDDGRYLPPAHRSCPKTRSSSARWRAGSSTSRPT
jgi:glutathione S-transferase